MSIVIDASALLAILFDERGAGIAAAHSHRGLISAVNLCESIEKVARLGLPGDMIAKAIERFEMEVAPFTAREAYVAGAMRHQPGFAGISLADRACLATAQLRRLPILTADRAWSDLGLDLEIVRIR